MSNAPIPRGSQTIVAGITVNDGKAALDFYRRAFGAEVRFLMTEPHGPKIAYAELQIGNSYFTLNDEIPQHNVLSPIARGGATSGFMIYVADCDSLYQQALTAGATGIMPPMDMFWGDRMGALTDPFGHRWAVATHKETLSEAEIEERRAKMMQAAK